MFKAAIEKSLREILQNYLHNLTHEAIQLGLHAGITAAGSPQYAVAHAQVAAVRAPAPVAHSDGYRDAASAVTPSQVEAIAVAMRKPLGDERIEVANGHKLAGKHPSEPTNGWANGRT